MTFCYYYTSDDAMPTNGLTRNNPTLAGSQLMASIGRKNY